MREETEVEKIEEGKERRKKDEEYERKEGEEK